jgi:hypothetical protein
MLLKINYICKKLTMEAEIIKQKSIKLENEIKKLVEEFHKEMGDVTIKVSGEVGYDLLDFNGTYIKLCPPQNNIRVKVII